MRLSPEQRGLCESVAVEADLPTAGSKLGVAANVRDARLWPLNGLRHPPEAGTNGWYLWRGPHLADSDEFFSPLHIDHLADWCSDAVRFIALPPGWRFLVGPGQEDVWYDPSLLEL